MIHLPGTIKSLEGAVLGALEPVWPYDVALHGANIPCFSLGQH